MHRNHIARRVATITMGTALSVAAIGGTAMAAPGGDTSPAQQTYTSPQPASTADFSGNGANVHGPYDSTRDGSASANGNGDGKATGKPCAGCVGKADNKNPKGQLPGGSDHNAGYECDRNQGIGQGNPAHTACTTSPTPTTPTPVVVPVTAPVTNPVTVVVAPATVPVTTPAKVETKVEAKVEALKVVKPVAAKAAPAVLAASAAKPATPATKVLGESVTRAPQASRAVRPTALPFTGVPVGGLLLIALVALSAGVALTFGFPRAGGASLRRASVATI